MATDLVEGMFNTPQKISKLQVAWSLSSQTRSYVYTSLLTRKKLL